MRSVAGCRTCRRRKLKCDEQRPECGQCRKAARICEPSELVFRHQRGPTLNRRGDASRRRGTNESVPDKSSVWITIPEQVTFVNVDNSYFDSGEADAEVDRESMPVETPSTQSRHEHGDSWQTGIGSQQSPDALSPESVGTLDNQSLYTARSSMLRPDNLKFILNPVSKDRALAGQSAQNAMSGPSPNGMQDTYVTSPQSQRSSASRTEWRVETDPEVAFLLRYYSEEPGKWLDLYFLEAYFGLDVPVKALSHPLLKCAACAYAAKHLSRTRNKAGARMFTEPGPNVPATTVWPYREKTDWAWYGAKYYAQAINLLRETLHHHHGLNTSPEQRQASGEISIDETGQSLRSQMEISEETLAAMAILCNYEFMSQSDTEWSRHLSGTKLLLDLREAGVISPTSSHTSKARKAIFWNFFRQDVFAAFILGGRTRLDTEDLRIWRAAGLLIDNRGFVMPTDHARDVNMKEDMVSNALIWILSKIVNCIAMCNEMQQSGSSPLSEDAAANSPNSGSSGSSFEEKLNAIAHELDVWHDGLTDAFKPCARLERNAAEPRTEMSCPRPASLPEIWFSSAMCGSTIQTYHLARILILIRKPQIANTALRAGAISDFLNIYRTIEAEIRYHSREIFGIALSSPTTSIYLHQTQTIFVAAQCLADDEERRMALDILRRVNTDLGWETEYRVQQLLKEWGWKDI